MKTLVIGASEKEDRYSNKAVRLLHSFGHEVKAIGMRGGSIESVSIERPGTMFQDIDTVTLYLNKDNQRGVQEYILAMKPRRVIFNPGTENPEFYPLLRQKGIEPIEACTLVLLRTGQY